ncbi:MAG: HIT family protein [Bacteroidales bacterium]|nr:HIT family protein [Bacteroidales bacterium]
MSSIFSKIVAGEIPCYKVAETENCFAFLDINPVVRGHVLCIPKKEVDYIFDLDDALYNELFDFAHRVARSVKQVCPCKKVGVAVLGLEVPHAHVHLIPMQSEGDMNFHHHVQLTDDEFRTLADQLAKAFQ